jgi:hypothetical protein
MRAPPLRLLIGPSICDCCMEVCGCNICDMCDLGGYLDDDGDLLFNRLG